MIVLITILKILGILLLVLLALIAVILLCPIVYKVNGDTETRRAQARVRWLSGIIRFRFLYDGKPDACLHILFLKMHFTDPEWKRRQAEKKAKKAQRKRRRQERELEKKRRKRRKDRENMVLDDSSPEKRPTQTAGSNPQLQGDLDVNAVEDGTVDSDERIAKKIRKIIDKIQTLRGKAEGGRRSLEKVKKMLELIREYQILQIIFPELQRLLIRLRPSKLQGEINFGLDDPGTTGQIIGLIAMVPFLYETELLINPDFEADHNYFNGNIRLEGKIRLIWMLVFVIRLVLTKEIRIFIKKIRRL